MARATILAIAITLLAAPSFAQDAKRPARKRPHPPAELPPPATEAPPATLPPSADRPPPADAPPNADQPPPADAPPNADQPPSADEVPPADHVPPADQPPRRRHPRRPPGLPQGPPPAWGPPPGYPAPYGPPVRGYGVAPTPDGYRIETEPMWPMIIAGSVAFGGAWLVSALVATATEQDNASGYLYIPLAGPWITMGKRDYAGESCNDAIIDLCQEEKALDTYAVIGLAIDGIVQAGGLAVFIAGLAIQREREVPVYTFAPLPVREGSGIQVLGRF